MNRRFKTLIRPKWLTLVLFVFLQVLMSCDIFAQSITSISGKIENVKAVGEGRFELGVRTDKGLETFLVDDSTLIEATMLAKKIRKGNKIFLPSMERVKGIKGMKAPFGNMSPRTKKILGLPDIPEIPEIPEIPKVPKIPQIPRIPKVPGKSGIPNSIPTPSQISGMLGSAKVESGKKANAENKGQAPLEEGQEMVGAMMSSGQNPPSSTPKGEASAKQPEPVVPELPKDPGFASLTPSALSPAGNPSPKEEAKKVVELKTTAKGIAVKLEGEEGKQEELILSPEEEVFQVLTVEDLHKDMTVNLEVVEDSKGKMVQRITVA